jgi:putative tryptophan/tyrosine transport system substrate-binding protein
MRRRGFFRLVGGAAITWPLGVHAQQTERMRRIGVFMPYAADDQEGHHRLAAFREGLQDGGWTAGKNLQIDVRWGGGALERYRQYAAELISLSPDVLVGVTSPTVTALQQQTRKVPIVFVGVIDPVGAGLVSNLAHPDRNTTGFTVYDYGLSPKWLALLKEIAPNITRAALFRDPASTAQMAMLGGIQSVASSLRVELSFIDERDDLEEIKQAVTVFARQPNGGLIVFASPATLLHRDLIITLAAQNRLPAVYADSAFVAVGGLTSYGPNRIEQYRPAASYVGRILKGESPANLPVQAPTKYELVINLKTAKALDLDVPPTTLARADEVIE